MYIMAVRKPEQGLNDWGYGQILAVLIWAPVIVEFFVEFIHAVFDPSGDIHKGRQKPPLGVSDENQLNGEPGDDSKQAMSEVRED
jgi:hypothetical protein